MENTIPKLVKKKARGRFPTAAKCQEKCQATQECNAILWKNRACWLMSIGTKPRQGFTSGPKLCDGQGILGHIIFFMGKVESLVARVAKRQFYSIING